MQYNYPFTPVFTSNEQAAIYYNTICFPYQSFPSIHPFFPENLKNSIFTVSSIRIDYQGVKGQVSYQRPTDDMESFGMVKVGASENSDEKYSSFPSQFSKKYRSLRNDSGFNQEQNNESKSKRIKKNIESNLINNSFSFLCSGSKSYRLTQQLFNDESNKLKIFYIFSNIIKKVNGKYFNKMSIKDACQIIPKQTLHRSLSKSAKRLEVLSLTELREAIRKLIFYYMRGSDSILPLLTSKKICRKAFKEYMNHRRKICMFLTTVLREQN